MANKNDRLQLGKANFIILAVAAILLIIGYIIMAQNEINVSPLILVLVYVVLIPFGLLYKGKTKE